MASPARIRVLVVDDEEVIADSLTMILNTSGFEARAAYSGEMAIRMARNFHPDIVVSDVVMPGMTGIEAALHLRSTLPACKVLLITGNLSTPALIAGQRGHQFEVLRKPVHPDDLLAKIRTVMAE
ncbi:MAG TPA: response regulator [Terracidiphilus sp.]|nr:response regulator [Terracidiphilus sp.]